MTQETTTPAKRRSFAPWVWLPFLLTLGGLGVATLGGWAWNMRWTAALGGYVYLAGLLYFTVQTVGRFALKQWRQGLWSILRLVFCLLCAIPAALAGLVLGFSGPNGFLGPSEDGFADGLTIPTNISVTVPSPTPERVPGTNDTFELALLAALASPATNDETITPSLPSLRALARDNRAALMRHLASSAAWRVFEEDGILCATRRWQVGSAWLWDLHGYYSKHDIDQESEKPPYFQSRVTLGLNGKPWGNTRRGDWFDEGNRPIKPSVGVGNNVEETHCIIRCASQLVVEIFEQSPGRCRRLTREAVKELEREFKGVLDHRGFDRALLPIGSIRRGKPSLNLSGSSGIYNVGGWQNPGESGTVYLKAFEVTRNYRLSSDRLFDTSNERVGWSDDPDELFLTNTLVTIYEGDWGKFYAARFELWFRPDSGAPERKLIEQVFKIEGWQR